MPGIEFLLTIAAPPRFVYRAVTEQAGLASWWTPDCVAVPEVGSVAEFRFGDRYHNRMLVVHLEEDRVVRWECLDGDEEWVGTTFEFALEGDAGKTTLRFVHGDWREETEFYRTCREHWASYMVSLKAYCETGHGMPYREGA